MSSFSFPALAAASSVWWTPLSTLASWAVVMPYPAYTSWARSKASSSVSRVGAGMSRFFSGARQAFSSKMPLGSRESGETVRTTPPAGTA